MVKYGKDKSIIQFILIHHLTKSYPQAAAPIRLRFFNFTTDLSGKIKNNIGLVHNPIYFIHHLTSLVRIFLSLISQSLTDLTDLSGKIINNSGNKIIH